MRSTAGSPSRFRQARHDAASASTGIAFQSGQQASGWRDFGTASRTHSEMSSELFTVTDANLYYPKLKFYALPATSVRLDSCNGANRRLSPECVAAMFCSNRTTLHCLTVRQFDRQKAANTVEPAKKRRPAPNRNAKKYRQTSKNPLHFHVRDLLLWKFSACGCRLGKADLSATRHSAHALFGFREFSRPIPARGS